PEDELRDAARARLMGITHQVLLDEVPWPASRALWAARMDRAADNFLDFDEAAQGISLLVENVGSLSLPELGGFTLFGTPDRIDPYRKGTESLCQAAASGGFAGGRGRFHQDRSAACVRDHLSGSRIVRQDYGG